MDYYKQSSSQVLSKLDSSIEGLSKAEARNRLKRDGLNELVIKGSPLWRKIIEPFLDIFTAVLAIAVVISVWHKDYIDAVIIAAIILISAIIYYVQRISADKVLRSLRTKSQSSTEVLRAGKILTVASSKIVVGDIIILKEGDKVPADARILKNDALTLDESSLTGESLPIAKQSQTIQSTKPLYEQSNIVFQGSFVVSGQAHAIVTATGNQTEFGQLAKLSTTQETKSPIQQKVDSLITRLIFIVIGVSMIALVLTLSQGMEVYESIRFVIALAVSAVPEGLPVAISVVLVLGMRRMAARKALVRSMRALETLGAITTIATDKTGTLTENKLQVESVWSLNQNDTLDWLRLSTNVTHDRAYDPVDQAVYNYTKDSSGHPGNISPIKSFPFNQSIAMSGCQYHSADKFAVYVKGSPEKIIDHSNLTDSQRAKIYAKLDEYTSKGYRVLGFASFVAKKQLETIESATNGQTMTFGGLVAIADTLRKEARAAISTATGAGITVRMITGDHQKTAYQIGHQLGLVRHKAEVFDCSNLKSLDDAELNKIIDKARVFSRVIPEDKYRLLTILKQHNITAMTGDGVNDVPALTRAHVGIAMGSGTSIAKDAGDIILIDDNFSTIVDAIREGRIIFSNVKRMVVYLLSTNGGEVLLNLGALALGTPIPLVPVQLLWVNLVTDTSMAIPLGLEPGDRDIMKQPPMPAQAPLLSRIMTIRLIIIAVAVGSLSLGIYLLFLNLQGLDYARTIAFSALVSIQWSNALALRSDTKYSWQILAKPNRAFWLGLALSLILHIAALFSPLAQYLHITTVNMSDLIIVSLISLIIPLLIVDLHKLWINKYQKS